MRDIVRGLGDGWPLSRMQGPAMTAQQALARVPGMFPSGSDKGKTSALPLVWSDPERFGQIYKVAAARMAELVATSRGNDRDAFGAAAGRMAAACGACHMVFRAD